VARGRFGNPEQGEQQPLEAATEDYYIVYGISISAGAACRRLPYVRKNPPSTPSSARDTSAPHLRRSVTFLRGFCTDFQQARGAIAPDRALLSTRPPPLRLPW
jgi:hypothetical protein